METKKMVYFAKHRIKNLKDEIDHKEAELAVWEAILAKFKPCKKCKGEGSIRMFVAQDESETRECEKCEGKGVLAQ